MLTIGKWDKYYNLPEIQEIRQKIIETYTNKLVFVEGPHKYYLDGVEYISVSEVTHRYKPIDGEQMAENCVMKWKKDQDPSYKYYGMSKEEILAQWKIKSDHACEFGTNVHAFGESMFYYMTGHPEEILEECKDKFDENGPHPSNAQEEAIVKFWDDIPENFVPVLAETKVFNKNGTQYAGTFDILFYYVEEPESPKNGLVIFDYKGLDINTQILTKDGWKTMKSIKVGDVVYDGNGNETTVIHTSDIHYKKCYKMYFNNGESIVSDYEHNWEIFFTNGKKTKKTIMTTEEIAEFMKNNPNRKNTFEIPKIKQFNGFELEQPKYDCHTYINIIKIEEVETVPTKCIQVDSELRTFLFGKYMMVTHNTNEDLYKNYRGQTLLWPFQDMLDQNVSYYTLQLSLYAIPLQNIGYKVIGRRLIWVKPDGTYEKVKIDSVSDRLREALNIPKQDDNLL